jgi:hypothetical protein
VNVGCWQRRTMRTTNTLSVHCEVCRLGSLAVFVQENHLTQIKRRSWHLSSGNRRLQYRPAYRISWTGELWFSSLSTQTTVNDDQIRHGSSLPRFPQLRVLRVSHRCRWRSVLLRQGTVSLANRTPMFRDSVLVFRVEYV